MKRRTFLLGSLGGAGLITLGGCSGGEDESSAPT
ncbi:MAG: twin-arginine translocation signal domain-containing protein, partial [Acidimicrobiia bacterium]|nr:twin-arginine translocation signal domain-containing protein [Acidimicrobiia bacterium]